MGKPKAPKNPPPSRREEDDDDDELPSLPGELDSVQEKVEQDIDDVLSEIGAGARVKIQRINPDTGTTQHAGEMKAEDFSMESLADVYGGGAYYVQPMQGRDRVGDRIRVEVDPSIPAKNPRARATMAAPGGDIITQMAVQNMESSRRQSEMMTTVMTAMMTGMTAMMKAAADMKPNAPDPLEQMKHIADIVRGQTGKTPGITELKEILALARELNGGGDADPTMPVIMRAIETVGDIVKKAPDRSQEGRPVRALPAPSVTSPATAPAGNVVTDRDTIDVARPWVKAAFPHWTAVRPMLGRMSPDTAARMMYDVLEDAEWGDVVSDVTDGVPEETEVTTTHFLPFAERTAKVFQLPAELVPWLSEVALHIVALANDDTVDEAPGATT